MSDDEEVVLTSSELHKYMEGSIFDYSLPTNYYEKDELKSSQLVADNYRDSPASKKFEIPSLINPFKKPELCSHTIYLIDNILKTALMYPDHVVDIENVVDIERCLKVDDMKPERFCSQLYSVLCSTLLLGSATTMALFHKRLKPLHCISMFAGSLYCGYKIYEELDKFYERKTIQIFGDVLERLFSITKRTLSFIFESEFVLKTKMLKEQSFYVPDNGWVCSNSVEGLKHCGLVLTDFRVILAEVFLNVTFTFVNCTRFMRTYLCLLPHVDCDSNYSELPDYKTLEEICANPSLEDLKKLNNMYLIAQSEFLRRLTLSFVKDFWVKGDFRYLKGIIKNIDSINNSFLKHINMIESFYRKCIKIKENKFLRIERNKVLNARNANGKLFIFARNFLTKAEAHILSLSLDLKMVNDWINECDENEENLGAVLQDRLIIIKSNIESFSNLYIDNLNILNIINGRPDRSGHIVDKTAKKEEESIRCVQKTGLEVGKSNFEISGQDEVLISLCCANVTNNNDVYDEDCDYEDREIQKCLPKNVLLELKCALKNKKEEWIEREKKALKSDGINELDFNALDNTDVENYVDYITSNRKKRTYQYEDSESDSSYDESESLFNSKKNVSHSVCDYKKFNNFTSNNSLDATLNSMENRGNSSFFHDTPNNSYAFKNYHCSFVDQIKSAQKSFSLSMNEEEFVDSDESKDNN